MKDGEIKNLIFDLGGVILDLSVPHTLQAFSTLSSLPLDEVKHKFITSPEFESYEKGGISDVEFREFVREVYHVKATDAQIDLCWNAMLRGVPLIKTELLSRLMNSYRVFLLSNTNGIHLDFINNVILPRDVKTTSLDPFFHRTYYSHLMRMRKPDAEIYLAVLAENKLNANETLFLDDNKYNIEGAAAVGIKTVHVTTPDLILDYFHE
ncbi:MAG TPA: HAD family phosphatase [Cyclobacteriaceae bacterium]|nr:HAD family phosphatase [Cyclobacteriaceae bacterium]